MCRVCDIAIASNRSLYLYRDRHRRNCYMNSAFIVERDTLTGARKLGECVFDLLRLTDRKVYFVYEKDLAATFGGDPSGPGRQFRIGKSIQASLCVACVLTRCLGTASAQ